MKNNISYTYIIAEYRRNALLQGKDNGKVYLTTEQIAELMSECSYNLPVVRTHSMAEKPSTIFGLTIVNVDLL